MSILRRALNYFRPDLSRILLALGLLLLSIGLALLKPWPMALIVDSVLARKPSPAWVPDFFRAWPPEAQLGFLIAALLAVHLAHATTSAIHNYTVIGVGLRGLQRVRNEVFGWLQRLSLRFHHGTEAGDIIFRAGTDTNAFQSILQNCVFITISALFTLVLMTAVMLRLSWKLTVLALVTLPALTLVIRAFGREMRGRGLVAQRAESKVYALIHQGIAALPLTQSYTREQHEQRRFAAETDRAQKRKMSQHGLEVFYWFVISVILCVSTAAVTWFGARQVMAGKLTLGELLVFLSYLTQLFDPLNQLSGASAAIASAGASIRRVFEILDAPNEVQDMPAARPVHNARAKVPGNGRNNGHQPVLTLGNISYHDISFSYDGSRDVLQGVNFELNAGDSAALIGPSGAGKTTLLNLLPRFFDPSDGAVKVEGVDVRQLRVKDLRAQIALVLQEPILLPASVAENIAYGKPNARLDEIEAAARAANAHDFIHRLPLQYRTIVGEGGTHLSVGERQRINLARAFLKDAPILLMDEPTSALDVESEAQVVEGLSALMRGRTTLMVAHRLTTIQRVSKILVLEDGRLAQCGTPTELLAGSGYYARVVSGQVNLD
jgi:ATP-binding cassette subfamily B protein/subfamily B ATP-binding cassette protein MsbA